MGRDRRAHRCRLKHESALRHDTLLACSRGSQAFARVLRIGDQLFEDPRSAFFRGSPLIRREPAMLSSVL